MELDICEIEFYTEFNFQKIEFQNGGILLHSLETVLFYRKFRPSVVFGHSTPKFYGILKFYFKAFKILIWSSDDRCHFDWKPFGPYQC